MDGIGRIVSRDNEKVHAYFVKHDNLEQCHCAACCEERTWAPPRDSLVERAAEFFVRNGNLAYTLFAGAMVGGIALIVYTCLTMGAR